MPSTKKRSPPPAPKWKKGESGNPSGKPKGVPSLSTALKVWLRDGGRTKLWRSLDAIAANPDHPHFARIFTLVWDRAEGKPIDARDRTMEKLLSRIELHHGRVNVPIPAIAKPRVIESIPRAGPELEVEVESPVLPSTGPEDPR